MPDIDREFARLEGVENIFEGEEDEKEVLNYLETEVHAVLQNTERIRLLDKVEKWRRQREGRPESESKDFPWDGASNVVVPLALTNTVGISAFFDRTFGEKKPFWTATHKEKTKQGLAKSWTVFLDALAESPQHLNLRPAMRTIFYDGPSLGTQFVKVPWTRDEYSFKRRNREGLRETVRMVRRNSPEILPIRLEDTLTRPYWPDPQTSPWFGHLIHYYKHELLQRQEQGIYQNVDKVLARGGDPIDDNRLEELRRIGIEPDQIDINQYDIAEVHVFWDVDGDGIPEDVKIWFDPITMKLLRSEYNELGIRPFERLVYIPRPYELYGMGVGWVLERMQDELDALHNMRIDGTLLAMLQFYITRRGSGIPPGQKFRPLLNLQCDNPKEDFMPVKFPDLGGGTIQAEMLAKEYGDRASAATDALMGFEGRNARYTPAAGTMFLAQKGSSVVNSIMESMNLAMSHLPEIVTYQLVANKEYALQLLPLVPEEYHEDIRQVLSMNVEDVPQAFTFQVTTTDAQQTEMAKRQNQMALVQLYSMYGDRAFQNLQVIYNPQVPPPIQEAATKFYLGQTKLMEEILQSFGEHETDEFLPYVRDLEMITEAIEAMKDQQLGVMKNGGAVQQNGGAMGAAPAAGGMPGEPPGGAGMGGPPGAGGAGPPAGPGGPGQPGGGF